jgi:hypothetical protein
VRRRVEKKARRREAAPTREVMCAPWWEMSDEVGGDGRRGGGRNGKRRKEGRMTRKGKKGKGGVEGREYLISSQRRK